MSTNNELETLIKKYIDNGQGRDRLRQLLKNESVDTRYRLLIGVRGTVLSTWTGVYKASLTDDLESIRFMFDGFPSDKKYIVLKIQGSDGSTPLILQQPGDIHQQ